MTDFNTQPPVRIEGLRLLYGQPGQPATHRVGLQYSGPKPAGQLLGLQMPLLDALYLLNLLEQLSRENGFDHLRRPPGRPQ